MEQVRCARYARLYLARWYRYLPARFAMDRVKRLPRHAIPAVGGDWYGETERKWYPSQRVWIMAIKSGWQAKGNRVKMVARMGTYILSSGFYRISISDAVKMTSCLDLNINIAQATLGADVEVPTVDGPTKLKIPAGIQPGKVLRMRGKGVPHLRGNGRGDQMMVVNVEVPKNLTGEQRKLMEQLAESLGSEVRPAERGFLDWLKDTLGG